MPISVKHPKISEKADGQDDSLIQPTDWNAVHEFKVNAESLVGNPTNSVADATNIPLSDDFKFVDGKLSLDAADGQIVFAEQLIDTPTVDWTTTTTEIKADVVDKSITLAKMELGPTGGEILYYDKTSKAPVRLPYGTKGMVLQTGTAAVVGPPAVAATNPAWGFSGAPHAVLRERQAQGVNSHLDAAFTALGWRDRIITAEVYDTYDFVTLASNIFTLGIGTWCIEWSCPAFECKRHQTRLFDNTDAAHPVVYGTSEFSNVDNPTQSRSTGIAQVTITVATGYKIQHFCTENGGSFGIATGADSTTPNANSTELYTLVKIWRVA